jgi:hypothetical protein
MKHGLSSELSTILYNIEQQNSRLDEFLSRNKDELINLGIYDKINSGFLLINSGAKDIAQLF